MSLVLVAHYDAVATVTLNRPEAMNALSRALRAKLAAVMRELAADDSVRAIVLTGAGERAFTAGLDLKELGADTSNLGAANATDADIELLLGGTVHHACERVHENRLVQITPGPGFGISP